MLVAPTKTPPKGIYCPLCFGKQYRSVGRCCPTRGKRVVYYRCNSCKNPKTGKPTRFKTEHKLIGLTTAQPTPLPPP